MQYKKQYEDAMARLAKSEKQLGWIMRYILNRADMLASEYKMHLDYFYTIRNPEIYDIVTLMEAKVQLEFFESLEDDISWLLFRKY